MEIKLDGSTPVGRCLLAQDLQLLRLVFQQVGYARPSDGIVWCDVELHPGVATVSLVQTKDYSDLRRRSGVLVVFASLDGLEDDVARPFNCEGRLGLYERILNSIVGDVAD